MRSAVRHYPVNVSSNAHFETIGPLRATKPVPLEFNSRQQAFLDFVLSHYSEVGVEELAPEKLSPLLRLKYHDSIADAVRELGAPEEIQKAFHGFQRYLYAGTG